MHKILRNSSPSTHFCFGSSHGRTDCSIRRCQDASMISLRRISYARCAQKGGNSVLLTHGGDRGRLWRWIELSRNVGEHERLWFSTGPALAEGVLDAIGEWRLWRRSGLSEMDDKRERCGRLCFDFFLCLCARLSLRFPSCFSAIWSLELYVSELDRCSRLLRFFNFLVFKDECLEDGSRSADEVLK